MRRGAFEREEAQSAKLQAQRAKFKGSSRIPRARTGPTVKRRGAFGVRRLPAALFVQPRRKAPSAKGKVQGKFQRRRQWGQTLTFDILSGLHPQARMKRAKCHRRDGGPRADGVGANRGPGVRSGGHRTSVHRAAIFSAGRKEIGIPPSVRAPKYRLMTTRGWRAHPRRLPKSRPSPHWSSIKPKRTGSILTHRG